MEFYVLTHGLYGNRNAAGITVSLDRAELWLIEGDEHGYAGPFTDETPPGAPTNDEYFYMMTEFDTNNVVVGVTADQIAARTWGSEGSDRNYGGPMKLEVIYA